jgi:hypothetical protein
VLGLIAVPVVFVSIALIFGPGSYSEAIKWVYNDFASYLPIYKTLVAIFPSADIIIRTLWVFTFTPVVLLGAALTTFWGRKDKILATYATVAWTIYVASLVPTLLVGLAGLSQLFFIYYSLCILSTLAGYGLIRFFMLLVYRPALRIGVVATVLFCFMLVQLAWPLSFRPIGKPAPWSVWPTKVNFDFEPPANLRSYAGGNYFVVTDEMKEALSWARQHLTKDDVFITNRIDSQYYGIFSEHRAFYETTYYTPAHWADEDLINGRYGWRAQLVQDWIAGKPDVLARMKQAGITYIYVDRLNGPAVPDLPGLAKPLFENRDFAIYAIP